MKAVIRGNPRRGMYRNLEVWDTMCRDMKKMRTERMTPQDRKIVD